MISSETLVSKFKKWKHSESKRGLILISTPFGFSFLLLVMPLILIFLLSFWTQNYLELERTFSFTNYIEAWSHPLYRSLMIRSLSISAIVTMGTVLLAFPMAYFISFHGGNHKALWLFLVTIPFWTSYLLRIFLWKVILGYNGVLNSSLEWLGVIEEPLQLAAVIPHSTIFFASPAALKTLYDSLSVPSK